jgi:predicted Abi (CAAX) family protease
MRVQRGRLLILVALAACLTMLARGAPQTALLPLWNRLHTSLGLALDLMWIGLLLFLISALIAPFEVLGWWAGWFGEEPTARPALGQLASPLVSGRAVRRWVVYLDGIGQASGQAMPAGETFLRQLGVALGEDFAVVRGIMPYSVTNQPMTEGRWLAWFWRWADRLRLHNPRSLLGLIINLRNLSMVAVSADRRYGPIFNQGTARVICDSLLVNGYPPESGTPITLLGFSGGGQICLGALPHVRRALEAPVAVISLGGVFAGRNAFLQAEHTHHLVGERDRVERLGPLLFPGRWRIAWLSSWNRARRRGKVSVISMGPVGHQVPGGYLDDRARLPEGPSHLAHSVALVSAILSGKAPFEPPPPPPPNNYQRFRTNPWQRPQLDRDTLPLPSAVLRPRQGWIGRLILPPADRREEGVAFEVFAAPPEQRRWRGQRLRLDWLDDHVPSLAMDVHFSDEARLSAAAANVHPVRLNHWRRVTPLESLAGARPADDQLVRLPDPVRVVDNPAEPPRLVIQAEPVQTTGLACALVRFLEPLDGDLWRAEAFDPACGCFGGEALRLRLPPPVANREGILPSTSRGLESGPLNSSGWYVAGVPDGEGAFVVQSLLPRGLRRFAPERVICGKRAAWQYVKRGCWRDPVAGRFSAVLLCGRSIEPAEALAEWRAGDRLLVLHVFGGIGGAQREEALAGGICTGHFAYGLAELEEDPLAGELAVRVAYRQVYAHNSEGIIAGVHDRWRYLGDRQWGWLGTRPIADILVRFPPLTGRYRVGGEERGALEGLERQLVAMTARYRLGDGSGAAFIGPAYNCSQDSNQALFDALRDLRLRMRAIDRRALRAWERAEPEQAERLEALLRLERSLLGALLPIASLRGDWRHQEARLGGSPEQQPLENLLRGLGSWRTLLPRLACDTVMGVLLRHGASALVQRADQVGGEHPQIAPVAPLTLF